MFHIDIMIDQCYEIIKDKIKKYLDTKYDAKWFEC